MSSRENSYLRSCRCRRTASVRPTRSAIGHSSRSVERGELTSATGQVSEDAGSSAQSAELPNAVERHLPRRLPMATVGQRRGSSTANGQHDQQLRPTDAAAKPGNNRQHDDESTGEDRDSPNGAHSVMLADGRPATQAVRERHLPSRQRGRAGNDKDRSHYPAGPRDDSPSRRLSHRCCKSQHRPEEAESNGPEGQPVISRHLPRTPAQRVPRHRANAASAKSTTPTRRTRAFSRPDHRDGTVSGPLATGRSALTTTAGATSATTPTRASTAATMYQPTSRSYPLPSSAHNPV